MAADANCTRSGAAGFASAEVRAVNWTSLSQNAISLRNPNSFAILTIHLELP